MSDGENTLDLSTTVVVLDQQVIDIVHPVSGKPTGWKITIAGPSHAKTIALADEVARERIRHENSIEMAQVNGRKWKADGESPDDRSRRNVGRIVKRIIGWSPNPIFKDVQDDAIQFSEDAAVNLLLRPDMGWILGQIADFLTSDAAFIERSAQT